MVPAGWDLPPAMFNLEISQSGSYVPHGILNRVILTRMVWVKLRYWNFEQLISSKPSWASPFLSCSPSSCFSCSTAILFCIRKRTNSTNEAWIDQQKNVYRLSKCTLQSLCVQRDRPDTKATHEHESQMTVFLHAYFRLVSTPFLFWTLTAALEGLVDMR